MLKSLLEMLSKINPHEIPAVAEQYCSMVDQALSSVNGMIADVIEVGSVAQPIADVTRMGSTSRNTLNENMRYGEEMDIEISYNFDHQHELLVDNLKVSVFSNIIGNAIHAVGLTW